jgi:hypothetical protein
MRISIRSSAPSKHDLRHTVITELAEMGVADQVVESISGHLSRRMLEHYSHVRINAKRKALDALHSQRQNERQQGDQSACAGEDEDTPAAATPRQIVASTSHGTSQSVSATSVELIAQEMRAPSARSPRGTGTHRRAPHRDR